MSSRAIFELQWPCKRYNLQTGYYSLRRSWNSVASIAQAIIKISLRRCFPRGLVRFEFRLSIIGFFASCIISIASAGFIWFFKSSIGFANSSSFIYFDHSTLMRASIPRLAFGVPANRNRSFIFLTFLRCILTAAWFSILIIFIVFAFAILDIITVCPTPVVPIL